MSKRLQQGRQKNFSFILYFGFKEITFCSLRQLREIEIIRLCLKHFRQQGYENAFKALQEQTSVCLEHSLITELHQCLVVNGEFEKAEKFISDCIEEGLVDDYLNRQDYKHVWRLQHAQGNKQPGNCCAMLSNFI